MAFLDCALDNNGPQPMRGTTEVNCDDMPIAK